MCRYMTATSKVSFPNPHFLPASSPPNMAEEEPQLGNRFMSVLAGVLGVAQNVAPFVPVPLFAPTVNLLATIITTVQVDFPTI